MSLDKTGPDIAQSDEQLLRAHADKLVRPSTIINVLDIVITPTLPTDITSNTTTHTPYDRTSTEGLRQGAGAPFTLLDNLAGSGEPQERPSKKGQCRWWPPLEAAGLQECR